MLFPEKMVVLSSSPFTHFLQAGVLGLLFHFGWPKYLLHTNPHLKRNGTREPYTMLEFLVPYPLEKSIRSSLSWSLKYFVAEFYVAGLQGCDYPFSVRNQMASLWFITAACSSSEDMFSVLFLHLSDTKTTDFGEGQTKVQISTLTLTSWMTLG